MYHLRGYGEGRREREEEYITNYRFVYTCIMYFWKDPEETDADSSGRGT